LPAGISVDPTHIVLPQEIPGGVNRQVPPPLHKPSWAQAVVSAVHSFPGSVPLRMKPQVPSACAPVWLARQDEQSPLQRLLQQTPSTQNPLRHWVIPPQGSPLPFCAEHFFVAGSQ
jgi:hypothetical protein